MADNERAGNANGRTEGVSAGEPRVATSALNHRKVHLGEKKKPIVDAYAAAHLYYEGELTQQQIARRMEVSRPTVSFPSNKEPSE